jgi:NhaP-type Na+/H+ or K+/H+ antiporter
MVTLGVIACLLFAFGLVSRRLERTVITAPMVFVAAGLAAEWAGVVDFGAAAHGDAGTSREAIFLVAELALVLLLFTHAARIDPRALRGNTIPLRLLLIGLPLTIGLGTLLALLVLTDLATWECAVVAAVLAPTDAALGQAVVSSPVLPLRVRQGLNVESGLNDGGSVPFLALFIALAAAEEGLEGGWLRFALEQIGYGTAIGAAIGAAGGLALRRATERDWTTRVFQQLALAALAVIAWFVADEAGGNGFIAAFVGGGAAGMTAGPLRARVLDFAEQDGELLNLAVFFIFGVFAADALGDTTWAIVAYALLSLTAIRMVPVAIALIGLGLRRSTVAFLGWFGPRGLASIILALVVVDEQPGLAGLDQIFLTMTVTVLISVLAHGITATPLTRRYAGFAGELHADGPEHEAVVELPTRRRRPRASGTRDRRRRRAACGRCGRAPGFTRCG